MECGYEKDFDLLGVLIKDKYYPKKVVEIEPGFVVDLDKSDDIASFQIVDLSEKIGLEKESIRKGRITPIFKKGEFTAIVGVKVKSKGKVYEYKKKVYIC